MNDIDRILGIRYVKLHFTIEFVEDADLLTYKASALRGGMGEMLLRANCIRDRKCEECDFEPECIVRRTMYSKMEIQPKFMSAGDSVGYVVECEDYREEFAAGDRMDFNLILFGKTIVYFSQFLNAFYALGMNGLGKEKSRFRIVSVTNTEKKDIMNGNDIDMNRYRVSAIGEYVNYRRNMIMNRPLENRIRFKTPLSLKYRQTELKEFNMNAIIEATARRIYMLDCFEAIGSNLAEREFIDSLPVPGIVSEKHKKVTVKRYSNHKQSAVYLEGIEGVIELDSIPDEILDIMLAGELTHIGKNTSFGFGRYHIS